jgi:hypothetical protein
MIGSNENYPGPGESPLAGAVYDSASNVWTPVNEAGMPPISMVNGNITSLGATMAMIGWDDTTVPAVLVGGIYDPVSDTWASIDMAGGPDVVMYSMEIFTTALGTKLVFITRDDNPEVMSWVGWIYDPATGVWTPINMGGSDLDNLDFSSIRMAANGQVVMLSGYDNVDLMKPVAFIYSPQTGTWQEAGSSNMPQLNSYPGSTQTYFAAFGGNFILIGEAMYPTNINMAGGVYNPASGIWAAVSITGIPENSPGWVITGNSASVFAFETGPVSSGGRIYTPLAVAGHYYLYMKQ